MEKKIEKLIQEGNEHTFENNSYSSVHGVIYTRVGVEMQSWIAECEDFIATNYGKDSTPWKIFERLDI